MKRLLILSDCFPRDLTDGKNLRVYYLCRELCRHFECYFIGLSEGTDAGSADPVLPFREIAAFDKRVRRPISWWRRFRLSDAHYLSASSPEYFAAAAERLRGLASAWQIDVSVTFEPSLAELTMLLDEPRVLDFPDCGTLALKRRLRNNDRRFSTTQKLGLTIKRVRAHFRERYFLRNFTRTVTISGQDRAGLLSSSGVAESRVRVIPNGVSFQTFEKRRNGESRSRSIVFWGNLDFPPNWTAVSYFFERVFKPYLAEKGIVWHIVGGGANDRIREIGAHPNVVLAGFQPDLSAYTSGIGAMVNPMVEGVGLKNKVLEAFAMELPVISSSLGAEAIACVPGEHFLAADSPQQFAQQVIKVLENRDVAAGLTDNAKALVEQRYGWPVVGQQYADLVNELCEDR